VRERAPSSLGADLIAAAEPLTDRRLVRTRLRETTQMRALRERNGSLPWGGSQDITPHVEQLRAENAWIDGPQLVQVSEFAGACASRAVLAPGVP
jgi:dsDNA-specific endonuclease/ATPase MutS2